MWKLRFPLAVLASMVACAAWAAEAPIVGAWKLDPAKSRLTDQMKVESAGGDRFTFDFGVGPETVTADGTDQPGYGGSTLAVTLEGPDALKVVRKKDDHLQIVANWTLSKDGKVLSDDFTAYALDGSPSNLKYVYQRTTPTSGFTGTWVSSDVKVNFSFVLKFQPYEGGGVTMISPYSDKPKDMRFDGKDYPDTASSAAPGSTYSARRIDERTMEVTDKVGGKLTQTQQFAVSSDLKTLTLTIHSTGTPTPNVFVFERV